MTAHVTPTCHGAILTIGDARLTFTGGKEARYRAQCIADAINDHGGVSVETGAEELAEALAKALRGLEVLDNALSHRAVSEIPLHIFQKVERGRRARDTLTAYRTGSAILSAGGLTSEGELAGRDTLVENVWSESGKTYYRIVGEGE